MDAWEGLCRRDVLREFKKALVEGWMQCAAQRHLMLAATALLMGALTVFRGWIVADQLPEGGPIAQLFWLVAATGRDFLVIGLWLVVGLLIGPLAPGQVARRIWLWLWMALALGLLFLGYVNMFAVGILGGPIVRDWIHYSDIANTDVILDSIFYLATPARVGVLFSVAALVFFGARGVQRLIDPAHIVKTIMVVGVTALCGLLLTPSISPGIRDGKLANAAWALIGSYVNPQSVDLAGLTGATIRLSPPDLGRAVPIPRPAVAKGAIQNVIVIAIDAVSTRYVQGFEGRYANTPNILRYQAQGMAFLNAYAHVPASNFFLVTLLAGVVPDLTRESMSEGPSAQSLYTLSEELAQRGFRTGFFNSSDNRFQNTEAFVTEVGFRLVQDYRDWDCQQGVYETAEFADQFLNTSNDHCTVAALTDWIKSDPARPFFAVMRTGMSHYPYYPGNNPQRFVEDEILNNYLNAISVSDAAFGQLMASLEAQGLDASTLVVVLGDHGEAFGEHGTRGHASGLYEENVHVPLLFINPVAFDGRRIDQIVGLSELAPTIADLLGIAPSPYWQAGSVFAPERPDAVFFFSPWNGFPIGFRQGDRKFIYSANTGESWLFDLTSDPSETINLAPQDKEAEAMGRRVVADWIAYHTGWMSRQLGLGTAEITGPAAPLGPGELVLYATGTRHLAPPQADIYLDGAYLDRVTVAQAPLNSDRAATPEQIAAAVSTFRLNVADVRCASRVEVRFINDAWEGEGQTGDTDFYIAGLEFAGKSYAPTEFRIQSAGDGGYRQGYFSLWRNSVAELDLFLPAACVTEKLSATPNGTQIIAGGE